MGKFDAFAASETPFRVNIKLDGKQVVDKDGKPFFIDVHAEDSVVGRGFDRQWRDRLLALQKDGKDLPTQEDHNRTKCAALTAAWYLVNPDTLEQIDVPCTVADANELYALPMAAWIWVQPWLAANTAGNFIKRSAKSSTPSQSGTSETGAG